MGRSLAKPPFVDGNKRTAFVAIYVFLSINGLDIIATDDEAQDFVVRLSPHRVLRSTTCALAE